MSVKCLKGQNGNNDNLKKIKIQNNKRLPEVVEPIIQEKNTITTQRNLTLREDPLLGARRGGGGGEPG